MYKTQLLWYNKIGLCRPYVLLTSWVWGEVPRPSVPGVANSDGRTLKIITGARDDGPRAGYRESVKEKAGQLSAKGSCLVFHDSAGIVVAGPVANY